MTSSSTLFTQPKAAAASPRTEASGFHSDRRSDSLSSTVQVSNLHLQFAKYLEIKNQILIEMPKWRTQGFILNCDVEVLISLIDQLAGGSRFFSEETAIRVEDACMEIEEIINCLGS